MRRLGLASTATAGLLISGLVVPVAYAKSHHKPVFPSKHKVEQAQKDVENEKDAVAAIRAKLADAEKQLQAAQDKAEMAAEAYNAAQWQAQQAEAAAAAAKKHAKLAAADQATQRKAYAMAVVGNYQYAPQLTTLAAIAQSEGIDDLQQQTAAIGESQRALNAQYGRVQAASTLASVASKQAQDAADAAEKAEADAKQKRDAAASAAADAEATASNIAHQKALLIKELAEKQHISVSLAKKRENGLEKLHEWQEEQRRKREAKRRAEEAAQQNSSSNPPASPGGIGAAIAFARAQIGDPYVWAADGMSDWDCSGLTMMALRQAGIYLPHYSVWQYEESTPISYSQLRPGDLVFWSYYGTVSSIHHVALYVGNDMIIQAPHTGAYVEEVSMWSMGTPSFYARP